MSLVDIGSSTRDAPAVAHKKITDDYKGKIRIWAESISIVPAPPPPFLPTFTPQKFSNHQEMNQWKAELLKQLARAV